jgi:hypothetical protein
VSRGSTIFALLCACLVAGCSGPSARSSADQSVASPPSPSGSPLAEVDESPRVVGLAVADAAARHGVAPDAVRVVRVEPRQWPDSGLGCPRPGMGYAQVITPGYLIALEAGGAILEYHTDRSRVELCAG